MPTARAILPSAPNEAESLRSCWQQERRRVLTRIFQAVARTTKPGKRWRAFRRAARRLNGQPYQCNPSRLWKISAKTLRNLFYLYRRDGVQVLELNYSTAVRRKVHRDQVTLFFQICARPGIRTLRVAFLQFTRESPTPVRIGYSGIARYLGRPILNELQAMVRAKALHEAQVLRVFDQRSAA